ncbi:uncharacterized protein LOC8277192 isoform X2 [Ricinus communis]|uniref:uncharacterized protein LOC8277192 isoform X2 n=1 Tax=Ricinus communis TaxID=3988 RepID=UPI00201A67F6|nr:uncharacterized protein LOC8277192 isoform X2 [Ricinus communis]
MASLGFRLPQFSEDLAWLPTWLQIPQIESSATHTKETLTNSSTHLQTSSREECTNYNFNLFLSGDNDASQISVSPSPRNVVHFCLRLSLDAESQQSESHDLNMSQPLAQRVETSAAKNIGPQSLINKEEIEGKNIEKVDCNAGPSSPTNCKDNVEIGERIHFKRIKDADVNEAVELSIAASEALVIHELMCSGSTSKAVPTGAILEAALQVKQARLEALEDENCCSSDEIDEIHVLSDLDDSVMENAFVDVGLSFRDTDDQRACGSDVSQVKDTPVDSHYGHKNGSKHVELMVHHDKVYSGSALGLNNNNIASLVNPLLHQSAEASPYVPSVVQPQVDVSSSPACMSEKSEGEEKLCSLVVDKFRSRWSGGWTVKEADTSEKVKQKNSKGVLKFFDFETSFLSESAYVAADENSFVQKHETGSKIASQSSIPFEGGLDRADEGICSFQEVRSSNQSLVDPLCSIVPCSISSENAGSLSSQNKDDREAYAQNCFSTKSEPRMENFQSTSDVNVEPPYAGREAVPKTYGEYFEVPVRRHLASLKTYSKLLPKHEATLSEQQLNQNHSSESEFHFSVGRDHGQNEDVNILRSPLSDHDEPAKDGPEQPSKQRRSPLVLNRKTRCHLQPSELLRNLAGEKTPERIFAQGTVNKALQRKNLQKIDSKLENPHKTANLVRKRVCLLEAEVGLQQNKDAPKTQTSQRNSSAVTANKRSKYSKPCSDSQNQDMKNCFKDLVNDMKRLIFHGLQFLLTGFSSRKKREIAGLIQEYGGLVLLDVPSPPSNIRTTRKARSNFQRLPIVICSKKLQTTKFLYGCAVNTLILKVKWLADSVAAGSAIPPDKYMIISNQVGQQYTRFGKLGYHDAPRCIFDRVGIMLHGKHSFCSKLEIIIKHGGGQVFKTLQRLFQSLDTEKISVGAIIAEDESTASRHLRHCALERKLPMMPASWIARSLHFGKLLPFKEKDDAPKINSPESAISLDWSQEI